MSSMDRKTFLRRFKVLQERHRRALGADDIEALERVQTDLAELKKQRDIDPVPAPAEVSADLG